LKNGITFKRSQVSPMPRKRINGEAMARFPAGTLARMKRVLKPKEPRAEFLRLAVERELQRRERLTVRVRA
jgi:hypothetical protein